MESQLVQKGDMKIAIDAVLTRFANGYARIGILDGHEPHPDPDGRTRLTVGELAVIHEFGAPGAGIPARSFLWLGTQLVKDKVKKMIASLSKQVAKGQITEQAALRKIAETIHGGMRKTFKDWVNHWAPNAPKTIKQKGHASPLLGKGDDHKLFEAIDYEVIVPGKK